MASDLTVFSALGLVTKRAPRDLQAIYERGWTSLTGGRSPFDFDRDINCSPNTVLSNWTVFACITRIGSDVAKMRPKLMEQKAPGGVWTETMAPAFSPFLRKPNAYQTWQKFAESWQFSKWSRGNAYMLLERDGRQVVTAAHVLDPDLVVPHVSEDGRVYYRLKPDNLAQIPEDGDDIFVPASEVIHDRAWCLFHPLIGLSPIFACGLAATQGIRIQQNSATFFANMSRPSGVLTAPGFLTNEQAELYSARWDEKYGAGKQGRTAILGNGLEYKAMTQTAEDSQMVEQLRMSAEMICSTFHVPGFKVGIGPMPTYQNASTLNQIYYDDCLQSPIEAMEALLDEALGLPYVKDKTYRTELDLDALLRMDEGALTNVLKEQVGAGISAPNEARFRLNMGPVTGGESPMIQQQNYSLAAIATRDKGPDPFGTAKPEPAAVAPTPADPIKAAEDEAGELATALILRFTEATHAA